MIRSRGRVRRRSVIPITVASPGRRRHRRTSTSCCRRPPLTNDPVKLSFSGRLRPGRLVTMRRGRSVRRGEGWVVSRRNRQDWAADRSRAAARRGSRSYCAPRPARQIIRPITIQRPGCLQLRLLTRPVAPCADNTTPLVRAVRQAGKPGPPVNYQTSNRTRATLLTRKWGERNYPLFR